MNEIIPFTDQRAVTAAGTPERLQEDAYLDQKVISVSVVAEADNTGNIFICHGEQSATITTDGDILRPGEAWELDVSMIIDSYIDLYKIWIDAATSGDGVSFTALRVGL